jgi:flavin-dependent dehydrogenase
VSANDVDLTADVVVVGAGPAGATTALVLARACRTLLVDRIKEEPAAAAHPIGESLPAAAWRLLRDMGLWEDFQRQGHLPCHVRQSHWGNSQPSIVDSLRDAYGPGWLLDRVRFDAWLRNWARRRGAALVAPAKAAAVAASAEGWRLTLVRRNRPLTVAARWLVDAGGRAAPLARMLRLERTRADRLICRWMAGQSESLGTGLVVTAEPDGWWYAAGLPGGRRIVAFHTDADLPAARATSDGVALLARARAQSVVTPLLGDFTIAPDAPIGVCAAHSAWIERVAGAGWIAVGDAALACDPLSAQGVFNALYSGLLGAGAIREALTGDSAALGEYQEAMRNVAEAYRSGLATWYGLETRWLERPFWARRAPYSAQAHPFPTFTPCDLPKGACQVEALAPIFK